MMISFSSRQTFAASSVFAAGTGNQSRKGSLSLPLPEQQRNVQDALERAEKSRKQLDDLLHHIKENRERR
jgi:hypothetical protein